MSSFIRYLLRRVLGLAVTFLLVTAGLYGILMLAPAEQRATLYFPRFDPSRHGNPAMDLEKLRQQIIEQHGMNDPYPLQYGRWLAQLLRGDLGWSPALRSDVLTALWVRTPATLELTLYTLLFFIPLGLLGGTVAAWRQNRLVDYGFRLAAFIATSTPLFILALVLLSIFYVGLGWFPISRLGAAEQLAVADPTFRNFTGLLTLDGLLNQRPDITLGALRRLVLPVFTLSLYHWASLGRLTRAAMIEELGKDYVVVAHGKGLPPARVVGVHALRNAMIPALNSIGLSAAALVTGVFVVEIVFDFPGISAVIVMGLRSAIQSQTAPDFALVMGFAVYSVLLVFLVTFCMDVLQALADPRIRERVAEL